MGLRKHSRFRRLAAKVRFFSEFSADPLEGQEKFDPLAVCCYVRVELERKLYTQLADAAEKEEFIKVHRTTKKFDYARSKNVIVPEVYYLLAIIYNAGLHIRENTDETSPVATSLGNKVIRNMLEMAMRD